LFLERLLHKRLELLHGVLSHLRILERLVSDLTGPFLQAVGDFFDPVSHGVCKVIGTVVGVLRSIPVVERIVGSFTCHG
jgi:hypothetical protein